MGCLFSSPWPRSTFWPKPPDLDLRLHLPIYLVHLLCYSSTVIPIDRGGRELSIDTIKEEGGSLYSEIFASKRHFGLRGVQKFFRTPYFKYEGRLKLIFPPYFACKCTHVNSVFNILSN